MKVKVKNVHKMNKRLITDLSFDGIRMVFLHYDRYRLNFGNTDEIGYLEIEKQLPTNQNDFFEFDRGQKICFNLQFIVN